jgi:MATE family multidrug resistance protein
VSAALAPLFLPAEAALRALRQPAGAIPDAAIYARLLALGMPAFLAFTMVRACLQAFSRMRAVVVTILLANVLNALLDWVLIFGHLGCPALGVEGAAIATVIARWAMLLMVVALGWAELGPHLRAPWRDALRVAPLLRMLRVGIPIGAQLLLEMGVFGATALLMGQFGERELAAHQVAIHIASLTFMVPLGISIATSVRVGYGVGAGDMPSLRRTVAAAAITGGAVMAAFAVLLLVVPAQLAALFTGDASVIAFAATLIPIAGVFQVFDGLQVVAIGVLRGMGNTRTAVIANVIGFWVIGFPLALWLAWATPIGPPGLWWGLVIGLAIVAAALWLDIRARLRRDVARLQVEAPAARAAEPRDAAAEATPRG